MGLVVLPATVDRWDDVARVFGRRGEDPSWCWCQLFLHPTGGTRAADARPDNRAALRRQVAQSSVAPGVVAYWDDEPVGWSRIGPRDEFPGVTGNRAIARLITSDPGAWWITCFAVASRHRRKGVGAALLAAAVELARSAEATSVEGHPCDVAGLRAAKVSGAALYTGTLAMFLAAGFTEVGRTYPTRPVMRRRL